MLNMVWHRLQWTPHYSLWGRSISMLSSALWRHLLVDIDNTDEEQNDHHQVIQDPQQSAEGGVSFQGIVCGGEGLQRRGGDGHHGPHAAQSHPEEEEPDKSSYGAQTPGQEKGCVTQVVCHLDEKRPQVRDGFYSKLGTK